MNNNMQSVSELHNGGYDSLDLLKFIMAVMVVAVHTGVYSAVVNPWCRIAVPLFFIISSFFFFKKINSAEKLGRQNILKHYLVRVTKLYLFWMVVQFPINFSWHSLTADGIIWMPLYLLRKIVFSGMFGGSWFLLALIYGIPIIYFLSKYLKNWLIVLMAFALNVIVTIQCSYVNAIDGAIRLREICYALLGCKLEFTFIVALFWIGIGKLFAEHISEIKIPNIWLYVMVVISMVLLFFEHNYIVDNNYALGHSTYFSLMVLCPLMFLLCTRININLRCSYQLRKLSTLLFCMHFSVKKVCEFLFDIFDYHISGQLLFLSVLLICLAIGLLIINVQRKNNSKILKYAC